jgi:hypothetical protein
MQTMSAPDPDRIVNYESPGIAPRRGAWWLVRELLAGVVMFAIVSGVFWIGAALWWEGPVGQLGGVLYLAAIIVPMAVGVGGWVLLAVLLAKALREWRT